MTQTDIKAQPFKASEHTIEIKTKNGLATYLPVQWRLVWFREACPEGKITTEKVFLDPDMDTTEEGFAWNEEKRRSEKVMKTAKGFAVYHAHVEDGKGGIGEGSKSEKAAAFADYIEKAETGAIGRALASLGYGTQFAPDFEGDVPANPVDSPVHTNGQRTGNQPQAAPAMASSASPKAAQAEAEPSLAQTNRAKIDALIAEYEQLCPDQCKMQNWNFKLLRDALLKGKSGVLPHPDAYTGEHVIALAGFVRDVRKQKAS